MARLPWAAASVLTMMFSNSATSLSAPATFTVSWKSWPLAAGGVPICPAATSWFCWRIALMTSLGVSERARSFCGSSHTRMLYWPMPNTVTSPTPGRRASTSRMRIEA